MIVRVPRLTDSPRTGEYGLGSVGRDSETKISRADVARFMLEQLNEDRYLRQKPMISY